MSYTPISIPEFGTVHDSGEIRLGHAADLAGTRPAPLAATPGRGAAGLLRYLGAAPGAAFTYRGVPGETPDPAAWDGGVECRACARHRPPGTRHAESAHLWRPDLPGRVPGRHSADRCSWRRGRPASRLLGGLGGHHLHAPGGHLAVATRHPDGGVALGGL